jgi:hypothetical protein
MKTMLLDVQSWDLCLDASGNMAMASLPYSAAQDAASAIKLFKGEYWYDTALGVPYFQQILGKQPPLALMRAKFIAAAKTVPDVVSAQCFFSSLAGRVVRGQVQVIDINGRAAAAAF